LANTAVTIFRMKVFGRTGSPYIDMAVGNELEVEVSLEKPEEWGHFQ
jgi:hypothetical protein